MAAAGIPVVTYDIAQPGFYFVGIDNLAAGIAGGEGLGKIAKEKWNCEVDLVISSEGAGAGIVNEWRTGGMRTGVKNICPDIPEEKYVSLRGQRPGCGRGCRRLATCSPPIPMPRRSLVVGLNDGGVLGVVQAAEQLGRADEVIAWGQDGAFITGDNVNPHLAGSVFYFLEGYAVYAIRDVIDPIAAGNPPPVKDDAGDPASRVEPCPVTAAEAAAVPDMPRDASRRSLRRLPAPPHSSSSARRNRRRARLSMTDVATATPVATSRRLEAFRANLPAGWGNGVTVLGAWIAADHRDRPLPRRLPVAPDACSRSPSPWRSSACSRSRRRSSASAAAFIDLSQPAALTLSRIDRREAARAGHADRCGRRLRGILAGVAWGFVERRSSSSSASSTRSS